MPAGQFTMGSDQGNPDEAPAAQGLGQRRS